MNFTVDIDEADVEVLTSDLAKSKDLFTSIAKSLNNISTKSQNASRRIKPVLRDVNRLNESKKEIEKGLNLLQEVSTYASQTLAFESTLKNSIEATGIQKFLSTLIKSKALLSEMKTNIKSFKGILINLENLINQSDLKLENYFQRIFKSSIVPNNQTNEIALIVKYFYSVGDEVTVNRLIARTSSSMLHEHMKSFEVTTKPIKRSSNIPYEKGSNGINKYNDELIKHVKESSSLLVAIDEKVQIPEASFRTLLKDMCWKSINEDYANILETYINHFKLRSIITDEVFVMEVIDNIARFERFLSTCGLDIAQFSNFNDCYKILIDMGHNIFLLLIENCESRIKGMEKVSDLTITEVVVELISRLRKVFDYESSLKKLISGSKLGSWLNHKPPVRFISVYTSVIPNSTSNIDEGTPEHLISCFVSDYIDCVFVNVEIEIKSDVSLKKSMQGFYLIKNLVMVETIINRTQSLYDALGALGRERLAKLKNRFLKLFLDDWNYSSYIIIRDMTNITTSNALSGHTSSSMSSKEKDQVKELFKNFNESFEEALMNYQKYNITDPNLRKYLASEIRKLILNAYFKLYDKYGSGEFTKNRSKYIKYDKSQFEILLNEKL